MTAFATTGLAITFYGQSLNNQIGPQSSFPWYLTRVHYPHHKFYWWVDNPSIDGTSWSNLMKVAPEWARWRVAKGRAGKNVLVMNGGQSDCYDEGDTGAKMYADMGAVAATFRSWGIDKIANVTLCPSYVMIPPGPLETNRQDLNTLLRADASGYFDRVVDLAADPVLSDSTNTTYYYDGLHWNAAGAQRAALLFKQDTVFNSWMTT